MEPPQNVLRVNHRDKLTDAILSMLHKEELCDVTICCEHGQLVKAHRVILAACSTYFKQIFSSTTAGQYPIVFLKSITIEDLKAILKFAYKGEVTVPPGQIESLIGSAETLGVTGLDKTNLHQQDFVVNRNSSSANSSPSNGSESNGIYLFKSNSTRNEQNQPAQVEIQKCVSIQALPIKRGKKRKIRDESKVDAQIVKALVAPARSTPSTSKSRDSSMVRDSPSSSNESLNLSQHSTRAESNESHFSNKTITKSKQRSSASTSSGNIKSALSTSIHIEQQQQQSTPSAQQPSRKPSVIKSVPVRPVLNQPDDTKPVVPLTIPPYIKMESRPRGRPPKSITANATVVPRPLNPLLGLARSSLAGKIAAAAAVASPIASTGSPISQALMTPPPPQATQIIPPPTVPPQRITPKANPSSTPTVNHSKQ